MQIKQRKLNEEEILRKQREADASPYLSSPEFLAMRQTVEDCLKVKDYQKAADTLALEYDRLHTQHVDERSKEDFHYSTWYTELVAGPLGSFIFREWKRK